MTKPVPYIHPDLREAARTAILHAIIGAEGHAMLAGDHALASAIREIGAGISDRFKVDGKRAAKRTGAI